MAWATLRVFWFSFFFFGFVFILFSRACPPLVCVVCGNGELGKYKHRGKDVVWWPAGASSRRQQRPERAGAGTAATPGLYSPQPPARPPPLPASGGAGRGGGRGGAPRARGGGGGDGGGGRAGAPAGPGAAAGRSGPRRPLGRGERAARVPDPGRRVGGWAGSRRFPHPEAGPVAPAREGHPEQPQNKNRVWGIRQVPKTRCGPLQCSGRWTATLGVTWGVSGGCA